MDPEFHGTVFKVFYNRLACYDRSRLHEFHQIYNPLDYTFGRIVNCHTHYNILPNKGKQPRADDKMAATCATDQLMLMCISEQVTLSIVI